MTQNGMTWIYRIVAIGLVGYGASLVLGDLPPHDGALTGLEVLLPGGLAFFFGLWFILLPAAANLLNSFVGSRSGLLRWGVVIVNSALIVFGLVASVKAGWEPDAAWALTAFLVLLIFSILLARSWSDPSTT